MQIQCNVRREQYSVCRVQCSVDYSAVFLEYSVVCANLSVHGTIQYVPPSTVHSLQSSLQCAEYGATMRAVQLVHSIVQCIKYRSVCAEYSAVCPVPSAVFADKSAV